MVESDEWGKDPSVQLMRKIFRTIEDSQQMFFKELGVSFFDYRIRRWRERALIIFEKIFAYASRNGLPLNEEKASALYILSMVRVLNSDHIDVPEELMPKDEDSIVLFKGAFK